MKMWKVDFEYLDKAFLTVAAENAEGAAEGVIEMLKGRYGTVKVLDVTSLSLEEDAEPVEEIPVNLKN